MQVKVEGGDNMKVTSNLKTFFEEKELAEVQWELEDNQGQTHIISNEVVIEQILNAPEGEQKRIADNIFKLDFKNANINDYLKHLAKGLINNGD